MNPVVHIDDLKYCGGPDTAHQFINTGADDSDTSRSAP